MTIWRPEIEQLAGPRYLAIAEALAGDIRSGTLNPGDRLVVNGLQRIRPGSLLKSEVAEMGARGARFASSDDGNATAKR